MQWGGPPSPTCQPSNVPTCSRAFPALPPVTSHQPRFCPNRYLPGGSASNVLLEAAGLPAKLFSRPSSVVSRCVGGCAGQVFSLLSARQAELLDSSFPQTIDAVPGSLACFL